MERLVSILLLNSKQGAHISRNIITMHDSQYVWQIPFFLPIYWFKK